MLPYASTIQRTGVQLSSAPRTAWAAALGTLWSYARSQEYCSAQESTNMMSGTLHQTLRGREGLPRAFHGRRQHHDKEEGDHRGRRARSEPTRLAPDLLHKEPKLLAKPLQQPSRQGPELLDCKGDAELVEHIAGDARNVAAAALAGELVRAEVPVHLGEDRAAAAATLERIGVVGVESPLDGNAACKAALLGPGHRKPTSTSPSLGTRRPTFKLAAAMASCRLEMGFAQSSRGHERRWRDQTAAAAEPKKN
eukprot:scaffold388_cov244-Pinguiococcus_pyrenoidosus.AAC.27